MMTPKVKFTGVPEKHKAEGCVSYLIIYINKVVIPHIHSGRFVGLWLNFIYVKTADTYTCLWFIQHAYIHIKTCVCAAIINIKA